MTDTPGCSRCGTTTGQHSAKCLQAMALAWAMGVEERPRVGPVRVEPDPLVDDLRAEISQLSLTKRALDEAVAALERERVGASELEEEVSRLHAEMDLLGEKLLAAQAEVERLRQERAEWERPQPAPVTQLPPGYYDRLDRLAEIDAEIANLHKSA